MDPSYFQELYRYNFWANRQVWACITHITDDQFIQKLDYPDDMLKNQCFHTMAVESWWFRFLKEGVVVFLDSANYPDRAAIRTQWDAVEAYVETYFNNITPNELTREVKPDFWEQRPSVHVWQALLQVAHHSTDHRAQMLAGLHALGAPTIEQDYLGYHFSKH
ncbi:MAG: DinB family protein [Chloroflexota bacterium]